MALKHYNKSLSLLVLHASLAILWNVIGLWFLSKGQDGISPNATSKAIILLVFLIIGYFFSLKKGMDTIYVFLAFVAFMISFYGIAMGLTRDHSLWASDIVRYTGVAINLIGVIGFVFALIKFTSKRKERSVVN
jgi:predicted permease